MRIEQTSKTAHPSVYPGLRRPFVDSFLDRGACWMRVDHIPWHQNPLVLYEQEMLKSGNISYGKRRAYEWRHKGKIYHRDVFNHIWQKEGGKMKWIGLYDPHKDTFDFTTLEPK
jgi:hypothetical protein